MAVTLALAGDTMLGRGVAERMVARPRLDTLFSPEVREALGGADLVVLNLECCVSARGERWPDPEKPFFFRAPPIAAELLAEMGVDCVSLANNHALDFGYDALADTRTLLQREGIRVVGAGADRREARRYTVLQARGISLAVIAVTDHPDSWEAGEIRPGVAWADLASGVPEWLRAEIGSAAYEADAVLVTPHWGPNMTERPPDYVQAAARELVNAGATLVAGHSAHVFHAVAERVIYDMGEFIDDYAIYPDLRNDLGLLFLVTLDPTPVRLEALPLVIEYCRTGLADGADWEWIRNRFTGACAAFDTTVTTEGGRLVVDWMNQGLGTRARTP